MDFREKILKEGVLKHRQTSYALPRWKTRYVVFKISCGGRLQFIIYKEFPTSPANEVKEIPIEEFGGLESTAKVDSEKHVFSVITTGMTDSFSTDSPEELRDWTVLLQEYLGKELTFGITIPQKQGQLKSGRGVLRIRNTGFTITTSDSPPRCMGTWQIIHIRKFGGTDAFKFQTGSKCPSGELLYTLQTDDNAKVKALFNDLSQHKPIFSDDRVGRRMTLERNQNRHGPYRQSPSRFSLQSVSGKDKDGRDSPVRVPNYENKDVVTEAAQRLGKRNCPPPLPPNRRYSSNEDRGPLSGTVQQRTQNNNSLPVSPTKTDDQRPYQNITSRSTGGSVPHSPTKHRTRYPVPATEPVPEGYYNVSPPLALKKYPHPPTSGSPPLNLSPEDDTFFPEFSVVPPPPIRTVSSTNSTSQEVYGDSYLRLNPQQRPTMKIEGENLVVQRVSNGHGGLGVEGEGKRRGEMVFSGKDEVTMYQNLDFMNKKSCNSTDVYVEDTDGGMVHSGQPLPIIPDLDMQTEIHNYTNVDFAMESAQRRPLLTASTKQARTGDPRRKVSAPPLSRDRLGAMSYKDPSTKDPLLTALTSRQLTLPLNSKLKLSLSSHDLQLAGRQETQKSSENLPEYYNLFVPRLQEEDSSYSTTEAVLSGYPAAHELQPSFLRSAFSEQQQERNGMTEGTDVSHYGTESHLPHSNQMVTRMAENSDEEDEYDNVIVKPGLMAASDVTANQNKTPAPRYDHLELVRTNSGTCTPRFSPVPSPSPESRSRDSTPRPSNYDQLAPKEPSPPQNWESEDGASYQRSHSSSPQRSQSPARNLLPYERKVEILGHPHNYEYIEVMLKGGQDGSVVDSRVPGPELSVSSQHISELHRSELPTAQPSVDRDNELPFEWVNHNPHTSREQIAEKSSTLQSRKKPLPLQTIPLDTSFDSDTAHEESSKVPMLSERYDRPLPKPRKSTVSSSCSDLVSSDEFEVGKSHSPKNRERSHSPSQPPKIPPRPRNDEYVIFNGDVTSSGPNTPSHVANGSIKSTLPKLSRDTGSQSLDDTALPPQQSKDQSKFTVSLPATDFQFNKPRVPPRPRVLEHKHPLPLQYATMTFAHTEDDTNYAQVFPNSRGTPVITGTGRDGGSRDRNKVLYQSINFEMTEGLRKTREQVRSQRNREIEWLEQREQSLKTLTAK